MVTVIQETQKNTMCLTNMIKCSASDRGFFLIFLHNMLALSMTLCNLCNFPFKYDIFWYCLKISFCNIFASLSHKQCMSWMKDCVFENG